MRSRYPAWQKSTVGLVIAITTLFVSLTVAFATDGRPYVNYGQLTAEWWEWILEQPLTGNPNLDPTGADAGNGQPRDDVFFIAGTFGESATRAFTVPAATALFLPLLNNVTHIPLRPQPAVKQASLVWSSCLPGNLRQPMRYIDVMGGQKPHLLVCSRNNLGADTRVTYAPSMRVLK